MKYILTAIVSAFMLVSAPSFASTPAGGKMDDKKVDCSKKENAKDKACAKKDEKKK
jgi:cytochrome bd-type quinol oxidase subunit 1